VYFVRAEHPSSRWRTRQLILHGSPHGDKPELTRLIFVVVDDDNRNNDSDNDKDDEDNEETDPSLLARGSSRYHGFIGVLQAKARQSQTELQQSAGELTRLRCLSRLRLLGSQ